MLIFGESAAATGCELARASPRDCSSFAFDCVELGERERERERASSNYKRDGQSSLGTKEKRVR